MVGIESVIIGIVSFVLGALITWLVTHLYYKKSSRDLDTIRNDAIANIGTVKDEAIAEVHKVSNSIDHQLATIARALEGSGVTKFVIRDGKIANLNPEANAGFQAEGGGFTATASTKPQPAQQTKPDEPS